MRSQITAEILHDPEISKTVKELQALICRLYLPKLGPEKFQDTEYIKSYPLWLSSS